MSSRLQRLEQLVLTLKAQVKNLETETTVPRSQWEAEPEGDVDSDYRREADVFENRIATEREEVLGEQDQEAFKKEKLDEDRYTISEDIVLKTDDEGNIYGHQKPKTAAAVPFLHEKAALARPKKAKKKNELWATLEKQFADNWTGILGSAIMVIGVGFLGIYAALKISPLGRFALISGFAASLVGLFFWLQKKPKWLKLALWLRSSAAAIFLFACVGAIAIPGLRWVEGETSGLLLLLLGIMGNLLLGYVGKKQELASLHVLLSLIAIGVLPPSSILLTIAAIVALYGVLLTYLEKWNYHLLLTISGFFVFHLLYWFSLDGHPSTNDRILGIAITLIIGIAATLVHYRVAYQTRRFDRVPFIVHLANWLYLGLGLFLYSEGSRNVTFFLILGAIVVFLLARRAQKMYIRWLYITDTLIAQCIAMSAIASLSHWQVDRSIIWAAIFVENLIFLIIAHKERDALLYKIGAVTVNVVGWILLTEGYFLLQYTKHDLRYYHAFSLLVSAILGTAYQYYAHRSVRMDMRGLYAPFGIQLPSSIKHPLLGIVIAVLFLSYLIHVEEQYWSIYTAAGVLLVILFLRHHLQSVALGLTSIIFLVGAHGVNWYQLYEIRTQSSSTIVLVGLPLLVVSAWSMRYAFVAAYSKHFHWLGVYLFSIQVLLLTYYLFVPISDSIPGVIWLMLTSIIATLAQLIHGKALKTPQMDRYLWHVVYGFVVAFLIRHALVHLQLETYVLGIKLRLLIELLALGIFAYCATLPKPKTATYRSWEYLHPLWIELILLFSVLTIALEVDALWQPLFWVALSFALAFIGNRQQMKLSRLSFYAILMYWAAAFQTAFVTSSYVVPSNELHAQPWVYGTLSLVAQFAFLTCFYLKCDFAKVTLPKPLLFLKPLIGEVEKRRNAYVFYPLIICTAVFLWWTFDRSMLTLLWVVECLLVFGMSILLKEQHFRYVALGALAACIVRLIIFDLAQTSTLNRAIVFLGVGIIMLVMNTLYNKFKNRFE